MKRESKTGVAQVVEKLVDNFFVPVFLSAAFVVERLQLVLQRMRQLGLKRFGQRKTESSNHTN